MVKDKVAGEFLLVPTLFLNKLNWSTLSELIYGPKPSYHLHSALFHDLGTEYKKGYI